MFRVPDDAPHHILISGGEGDLARALQKELHGNTVHAPGRKEMDVRDEAQVEAYFAKLERLDILIANAGLTRDGTLTGLSATDFDEVVNVNLRGAFLCSRAAVKMMVKQRSGHIVLIGSRSGKKRPARPRRLLCRQGGTRRLCAKPRQGVRRAQCPLQCGATRLSRDEDDRRAP